MNPVIADNKPMKVNLEKDKEYYFCSCGRSQNQPFCDGSHSGTAFAPKLFKAKEAGDAWLCCCKYTANTPFCDGTHNRFSDGDTGKEWPDQ